MTWEDRAKFAETIAGLAVATRAELDDPTIELYFKALQDIPLGLVLAGANHLARRAHFFPKPAEWRNAVDEVLDAREAKPALPGGAQLALPGGVNEEWICEKCDNTGWAPVELACEKLTCRRDGPHTHPARRRCEDPRCLDRRAKLNERRMRYGTRGED